MGKKLVLKSREQISLQHHPPKKKQVKMNVVQSCPTLCDSKAYIVHGILQARILEWVAFPSPSQV